MNNNDNLLIRIEKAETIKDLEIIKENINKLCMLETPCFYLTYYDISSKWHKKYFELKNKQENK